MSVLARTTTIRRHVWLLIPLTSTLAASDHRAIAHALDALPASLASVARTAAAHVKTDSPLIAKNKVCESARLVADPTCSLQIAATFGVRG